MLWALLACTKTPPSPEDSPPLPVDTDGQDSVPADGEPTGEAACARLNAARAGETVTLTQGVMAGWDTRYDSTRVGCDVRAAAAGVTVRGDWTGDVRCRGCDGWVFEQVEVTSGSLRMIGGCDWTIRDARFDGGDRGLMAVVGTGSVDASDGYACRSPQRFLIERVHVDGVGCRQPDDPYPTHVRALYAIGANGVRMDGVIQDSTFIGSDCGYTVKLGATGDCGSWEGACDGADGVTFRRNVVHTVADRPEGAAEQATALLVSGNSDDVVVRGNTLVAADRGIWASGPFSGVGLVVEDNTVEAAWLISGRIWNHPEWGVAAPLGGERYVNHTADPCPELGRCAGNTRADP